jgi:hypothetical protein
MDEGIKGSEWSWVMEGKSEDFFPKRNGFEGS